VKKGRIEFKGKMQYINLKKIAQRDTKNCWEKKKLECNILPTIKIKWLTATGSSLMKSLSSLCLEKRQVALDEGEMIILMC